MSFSIQTGALPCLKNFEQAEKYFNETKPVRSKRWEQHQRPLRGTRDTHMAIESGVLSDIPFYDLRLYDTKLIRYFKPHADGSQAVWLSNYPSNSTSNFLGAFGWYCGKRLVDEFSETFQLQLSTNRTFASRLWGDEFTCKLIFAPDGRVITQRSAHVPFGRGVTSEDRRKERADFRAFLTPIYDMVEMQLPSVVNELQINIYEGRAFGGRRSNRLDTDRNIVITAREKLCRCYFNDLTPDEITYLVHYAVNKMEAIAESIANHRAHNYPSGRMSLHNRLLVDIPKEIQDQLAPTWAHIKPALDKEMLKLAGLADTNEVVPYPQFATSIARRVQSIPHNSPITPEYFGHGDYLKLTDRKGKVY